MIDWSRINELRDEAGDDAYEELRDIFLSEVEEALARLGYDRGPTALAAELHFLKGCAVNIGLADFAALCRKGEITAGTGTIATREIDELRQCFDASRTALIGQAKAA